MLSTEFEPAIPAIEWLQTARTLRWAIFTLLNTNLSRHEVAQSVEALRYKTEGSFPDGVI